jgi:mycothiol synthase
MIHASRGSVMAGPRAATVRGANEELRHEMAFDEMQHRPYQGETDLQRLLDALSRAHAAPGGSELLHPGDLAWALYQNTAFDPANEIEIWEARDGDLVGFGMFDGGDFETQCFTVEDEVRRAFESEALGFARERALATGGVGQLRTYILDSETARRELLVAQGFAVDEGRVTRRGGPNVSMVHLRQPLGHAPLEAAPAGFVVRSVGGEDEWPARVELHRTVWEPSRVTLEAYRRLRAGPVYRPDLDLVAVAPDGRLASYAIVWYDPASRVGEFEPVGTHPDFRRQGAGQAVLREGLRRLQVLGAQRALVSSSAHNSAAIRLYESVGFVVGDRGSYYRAEV